MSWEKCVRGSSPSCAKPARDGFERMPVRAALGLEAFLPQHLLNFSALSSLAAQSRQLTQPLWARFLLCESAYPLGHCVNHTWCAQQSAERHLLLEAVWTTAVRPTVLGWPVSCFLLCEVW